MRTWVQCSAPTQTKPKTTGVVAYAWNPSAGKLETTGSLRLAGWPASPTAQPLAQWEILSWKTRCLRNDTWGCHLASICVYMNTHRRGRTMTGPEVLANAQLSLPKDSFPHRRKASGISAECESLGETMLAGCCVLIPCKVFSCLYPTFWVTQDGREGNVYQQWVIPGFCPPDSNSEGHVTWPVSTHGWVPVAVLENTQRWSDLTPACHTPHRINTSSASHTSSLSPL